MQGAFNGYVFEELDYSVTEKICGSCLSLPMHPYLSVDDLKKVIDIFRKI